MKRLLLILIIISADLMAETNAKVRIEPLYGIETALVRYPEPARYITRATYGARALYGTTLLSGELEATQAKSREDYPAINQKVEDTSNRAGLGLRSTLAFGKYVGIYARAGGRASKGETIVTTNGVKDIKDNPLRVDPYAGAGLQFVIASTMALNAGVTLIKNSENKYDSQYTLGLTAAFGK